MEEILDLDEQVRIRREKLGNLQKTGKDPFVITKFDKTHHSDDILKNYEVLEGKEVFVAGRIILKRVMGKASFAHILDEKGKIQLYVAVNEVGEESYSLFKDWDLGDIIGASGSVFKTKTGEISVHVKKVDLLCKSLQLLPDKYHGLKDNDLRFRERYVDLIANPETRAIFVLRNAVMKSIREFLDNQGFLEAETPILQTIPGGAEARPFITHHNALDMDMYLRIATELYLKRLVVGGFEKVYELGRIFRNEGIDYKHNPEFTSLELYQAYTNVVDMMNITESIIKYVFRNTVDRLIINYEGSDIDLARPFRRVTMTDIVKQTTGLDFNVKADKKNLAKIEKELAGKYQCDMPKDKTWGNLLYTAFDQLVEKTLVQPTFVTDYPVEISPLAKRKVEDKRLTQRFELFMCGREMANGFSELNDPIDQRARFEDQMKQRAAGNDEAQILDEDFLHAIEYGLPPTGGVGIGIDRLVMLVTGVHSIRECLLFPTMKPK